LDLRLSAVPERSYLRPRLISYAVFCLKKKSISQQLQRVSVPISRPQLRRTLADSTGVLTAQVPAVVQEELKQRQVVLPQLPPQEEVASQPAVEVLDHAAGTHNLIG